MQQVCIYVYWPDLSSCDQIFDDIAPELTVCLCFMHDKFDYKMIKYFTGFRFHRPWDNKREGGSSVRISKTRNIRRDSGYAVFVTTAAAQA